jgi:hypothetical protein
MKRVLLTVVLSSMLASSGGCCCSGKFFHCVGRAIFGPWVCGAGHHDYRHGDYRHGRHAGYGYDDCHDGCYDGRQGYGHGHGYGHGRGWGYCDDPYCTGGCRGGCDNWYHTPCNSCCNSYGCGDLYLTDLFHPICDPCGWWHRRWGHRGYGHGECCCPCECAPHGGPVGYGGHAHYGHGCGTCGSVCDGCGPYASANPQGMPMVSQGGASGAWIAQGAPTPVMGQRRCATPERMMTAQAMRAPWEVAGPPRGGWVMNREYVVSQPKVMDDQVVQSRPKTPLAKKTVQASSATPR